MRIDEATFNIISNGLHAVAQKMGEKLVRSAYSVIIREARDCSTRLCPGFNGGVDEPGAPRRSHKQV